MFNVETSNSQGITVRGHKDGHLWVFVVERTDEQSRGLALSAVIRNPSVSADCDDRASEAQAYAEVEAWKRGLID